MKMLAGVLAVSGMLSLPGFSPAQSRGAKAVADQPRSPVVIELFTSQGCSSCPPADRLLSELSADPEVIALSFHVDYWNRLGWTDPFSKKEWSDRQTVYSRAFRLDSVYTPQIVVDGRSEMVGSDEAKVRRAIGERRRVAATVALSLEAADRGDSIEVAIEVSIGERGPSAPATELIVLLTESDFETRVRSGENAQRTLRNDGVVRALKRLDWTPGLNLVELGDGEGRPPSTRSTSRHRAVVVLLQEKRSRRILGAAMTDL